MEWISVKDRLPEPEFPVIVAYLGFYDGAPRVDGLAIIDSVCGDWFWYVDEGSDDNEKVRVTITHWMPLPEPPKEEQP